MSDSKKLNQLRRNLASMKNKTTRQIIKDMLDIAAIDHELLVTNYAEMSEALDDPERSIIIDIEDKDEVIDFLYDNFMKASVLGGWEVFHDSFLLLHFLTAEDAMGVKLRFDTYD